MADDKQHVVKTIRSHPDGIALQHGDITVGYDRLGTLIEERAEFLRAQGAAGAFVAVEQPKSVGFIVDYLAVWATGGTVIPLDPAIPAERRALFLDLARPDFLLRDTGISALGGAPWEVPGDGAFVYFTSGSTGVPKPVLGSASALRSFVDWFCPAFEIGPGDRFAFSAGLTFEASLRDILPPLYAGATLILPSDDTASTPAEAVQWLARNEISVVTVVPSVGRAWLRDGQVMCPKVRLAVFLGEPLNGDLLDAWPSVFPHTRDRVNSYGTTESGQATIYQRLGPADRVSGRVASGTPVPGTSYCFIDPGAVLDAELVRAALAAPQDGGEIVIVSRACSHGYLGLPRENLARFAHLGDGVKAYRTGDLGRVDANGDLVVIGRADDEVKINGVRVHPAEVLRAIQARPAIADAFVIATRGDTDTLHAFVVGEPDSALNVVALRRDLMEVLPLAMIPARFVVLESLPRLRTGKVDRTELARLASLPAVPRRVMAPTTETERALVPVFASFFARTEVSVDDDFFDLGGDSIAATSLAARIGLALGVRFTQRDVFAGATLAGMASIAVEHQLRDADPDELLALLDEMDEMDGAA